MLGLGEVVNFGRCTLTVVVPGAVSGDDDVDVVRATDGPDSVLPDLRDRPSTSSPQQ